MSGPAPQPEGTLVADRRFDYPGYFQRPAFCRLRLYQHAGQYVALLTEQHDNTGTSVTNCIETVCHRVVRDQLDPDRTVFIEHYPGRLHPKGGVKEETLDGVTFRERLWDHF